jgi:hypothetical protein
LGPALVDTYTTITQRNLDGYGAPTIEWVRVKAVLDGQLTQAPGTPAVRNATRHGLRRSIPTAVRM